MLDSTLAIGKNDICKIISRNINIFYYVQFDSFRKILTEQDVFPLRATKRHSFEFSTSEK